MTILPLGHVLARIALGVAMAGQRHYPCQCHDWVLREDRWELVARA